MYNLLPKLFCNFYLSTNICLDLGVGPVILYKHYNSGNERHSVQHAYKNILNLFQPRKCKALTFQYRAALNWLQILPT